jgi:hypothetical protein
MKKPVLFNGNIGTDKYQVAVGVYDSISIVNDSGSNIYYSVDGGFSFDTIKPSEYFTADKITQSDTFVVYAAAASCPVRIRLWNQGGV